MDAREFLEWLYDVHNAVSINEGVTASELKLLDEYNVVIKSHETGDLKGYNTLQDVANEYKYKERGIDYCIHAENENDTRCYCDDYYDCCHCGGNDCGCAYCYSCNACEYCSNHDE